MTKVDPLILSLLRHVSDIQSGEIDHIAIYGEHYVDADWRHTEAQSLAELTRVTCRGREIFEALKWARIHTRDFWRRRGNVFYFNSPEDAMIFKLKFHGDIGDQNL